MKLLGKICALGVAVSVLATPLNAMAATGSPNTVAVEKGSATTGIKTGISLEKAIENVKEKLAIPEGLDKFSSDYSEYDGKGSWNLRWYSGESPGESFEVRVNSATSEITNIYYYRGYKPGTRYSGLPRYTREKALLIAREWAAKMLPEKYKETVPVPPGTHENVVIWRDRDYPVEYRFTFARTAGGIPVANQGIIVGINGENGELMSFRSEWGESEKLPSASGCISTDRAKELFMQKGGYELTYFMPRKGEDPDGANGLKLVYRPKPPGRFIINAKTGEFFNPREINFYIDELYGAGGGGDMMMSRSIEQKESLTPAESKAVRETRDLIPAERAQKMAESAVAIPEGLSLTGKSLDRKYEMPGSRVWRFTYNDSDRKKHLNITINARTGELLGFSKDDIIEPLDYNKEPEVKITPEQAQKIAGEMIARLQPGKAGQVVLRQVDPEVGPWVKLGKKPLPGGYSLTYARIVNGIVYPDNGFSIRVNSTTGEVTSYDLSWWDTKFPSPEGVKEVRKINENYLLEHPMKLTYAQGYSEWRINEKNNNYYLIYHPQGNQSPMYDAISGKEIDYQGNPVIKKAKAFSDISGHPAEQDIILLADQGIISGDGGEFRPDETITVAEYVTMLVKSSKGFYHVTLNSSEPWHKQYIDAALGMGILEKDIPFTPDGSVNRLQLARMTINSLGYGKLARHQVLFNLKVGDVGSIPVAYRGYVAAALGLGLVSAEKGSFYPSRAVTRGEAATVLVKMLKS